MTKARKSAITRELPVLPTAAPRMMASRTSRWRAAVLIGVQLLMVLHVTHYLIAGRTLSPVEPSESMYTLELGRVNAGFVFFALAILSTVAFGRFFCGWGCHIVAVQDFCAWLMRKAGVRPQPLRSRLLLVAPFALAFYMFAWPTLARIVLGRGAPFPGFSSHLTTTSFWQTFPGPVFTVLTLATCGFAAVYLLGSKGFCTYGCPYGALFVVADKLSPTRIVVNEGCQQTGHCTATCTSNVSVAEEVKLHGMVVDPRCMKCIDCVSVCPNDALSLGLAKPPLLVKEAPGPKAARWSLGLGEELLLGVTCLAAMLAFRGLYDGPPLLMAMALGAITAFLCLKVWHLVRRATVRVQSLTLKAGGELTRAGAVFACGASLWIAFAAHSAFVQWHRAWGAHWLARTEVSRLDGLAGTFDRASLTPAHREAVAEARRHFVLADSFGLVPVEQVELGLAWLDLLGDAPEAAEARVRAAVARHPADAARHDDLVELLVARDRPADALAALEAKADATPPTAVDLLRRGQLLEALGRSDEARRAFEGAVAAAPGSPEAAQARQALAGQH